MILYINIHLCCIWNYYIIYTAKGTASGNVRNILDTSVSACMYGVFRHPLQTRAHLHKHASTHANTHTHTYITCTSGPCSRRGEGAAGRAGGVSREEKNGPGSRVLVALAAIHQQNLFLELWQRAATFLFRLRICFYVSRH